MYVYIVLVDKGFIGESDLEVYEVFSSYECAEKCCDELRKEDLYCFICMKKLITNFL